MAKKAAPKAAAKPAPKEKKAAPVGAKPLTKAEIFSKLSEASKVSKKDIDAVFDRSKVQRCGPRVVDD